MMGESAADLFQVSGEDAAWPCLRRLRRDLWAGRELDLGSPGEHVAQPGPTAAGHPRQSD